MDNKESYSPQETAQLMRTYLELYQAVRDLRNLGEKNPEFIHSEAVKYRRNSITEEFKTNVPENVREQLKQLGLEDILRIR